MSDTEIVDLSGVSPQRTFLESKPDRPDPASTLYIDRFTTKNADGTEDHEVSGVHVVLKQGHPNRLWDALHTDRGAQRLDPANPRVAIRAVRICCDTLEVHGALSIPEAKVTVFARRVLWKTDDAAIDTSPLGWSVAKARNAGGAEAGGNGADGRHAGAIRFFAGAMEPAEGSRPRLIARGGRGQDPGAGQDGGDGRSLSSWSSDEFVLEDDEKLWKVTSKARVSFDPPAVYVDYAWWLIFKLASGKRGEDAFPTSGTDALAPGAPGGGGDGGKLETNLAAAARLFANAGGEAGTRERDYRGGAAGTPTRAGKYKLTLRHNATGTDSAGYDLEKTAESSTKAGADAKSKPAPRGTGATPKPEVAAAANAWLHPLGVQKALEYARDLFLAGGRDEVAELLAAYDAALAQPVPATGAWGDGTDAQWTAAQGEIASMLQRLRAHLDYFGNPAGYMPLLSLQGAVKLYAEETRRSLRTLLLVKWIDAKERDVKEAEKALEDAAATLNADSRAAAERIVASEAKAADVNARIGALEKELGDLSTELAKVRNQLLTKAEGNKEREAAIKFGIRMAAAICQVVPVGQPVLGTVGTLIGTTADLVGPDRDEKLPDTVSEIGKVLKKANDAAEKAKEAKKKAEKEAAKEPASVEEAKKSASAWATAGKGMGPALAEVSKGLKALQVPRAEVDAELARLEAASPEWNKVVEQIRDLNARKAKLFDDLAAAFQALGEDYARVSSNAAAVFSMQQERGRALGRLDPAATAFVRQMGQRSRITLLKYLYLMVKAYETTVFKPIGVDWRLDRITDKVAELVKPDAGFDAATIDHLTTLLEPLFQENLAVVRTRLLSDFSFGERTATLQLGLSAAQTPGVLAALNGDARVVLDPLEYGLVLPDLHLARLSRVELKKLELDPDGPALPDTSNLLITLRPARDGTVRSGEQLYAVHGDQPLEWSWTLADGQVRATVPSEGARDVLDLVLGEGAGAIRQKVALPPAWSDLEVKVAFSPELPLARRPRITRLFFEFGCDASTAPEHLRVVNVRAPAAPIACSPADLAGRGPGFGSAVRIYSGAASVRLGVPERADRAVFQAWDLVGSRVDRTGVREREVEVKLDGHVLAVSHWSAPPARVPTKGPRTIRGDTRGFGAARHLPIRVTRAADAAAIGVAPSLADVEVVERRDDGWTLVNHRGVVGWVNAIDAVGGNETRTVWR